MKTDKMKSNIEETGKEPNDKWILCLYVAGQTPKSVAAINNLKKMCEEYLQGNYELEVIDLYKRPALAQGEQIIATPTLIKKLPDPIQRIVGDLKNIERFLVGLDLRKKDNN